MVKSCNVAVKQRGKTFLAFCSVMMQYVRCRQRSVDIIYNDEDSDELLESKHDVVEPVVYKNGPMTAEARNAIYFDHNLPGIGRRKVETEEEKKDKKVILKY